jgi:hypothetical protein
MIKIGLAIVIVTIVILGMATIIAEFYNHFRNKKKMAKSSFRWKAMLFIIGSAILLEKAQILLNN